MADSRIKILHTLPTGCAGGVETFVRDVAHGLDRRRFDLHACILGQDGPVGEELRSLGVGTTVLALGSRSRLTAAVAFSQISRNMDVVHINAGAARLRRVAKMGGARVITHVHGPPDGWVPALRAGTPSLRREMTQAFLTNSDLVVAFSRYCQDMIRSQVPSSQVQIIPYGLRLGPAVPSLPPEEARMQKGIPADARVIGFVGRLAPQKGIPALVDAAKLILERDQRVILIILGDGPQRDVVEQFAAAYPERVLVVGENLDVREWMITFDLVLMPSEWEPLGIVAAEAMAAGRPVVGFAVDGLPEVVRDGETGDLAPPGDVGALARAVEGLLRDPQRARSMGECGRQRAECHFSFNGMISALEDIYR